MKKTTPLFNLLLFILLGGSILFTSCSEDSSDDDDTVVETESVIELADLTAGVSIESATIKDGDPPAPNSDISFKISTNGQDAFLDTGYNISFAANDDIAGAYIRLLDSDGNKAASYFDVPASAFIEKKPEKVVKRNKLTRNKLLEEKEYEIDVDFNSQIPVGTFCYAICIYDNANNVSQISQVCVTVQSWGGSSDLLGEWVFDRTEPVDEETQEVFCESGGTFNAPYEQAIVNEWVLVLAADGDYSETYDDQYYNLDYEASSQECSAVYEEDLSIYKEKYYGKWSYNSAEKSLTIVDFGYENLLDPSENETYEQGELYFDGATAEIISNELVITETYDGETYRAFFKRK